MLKSLMKEINMLTGQHEKIHLVRLRAMFRRFAGQENATGETTPPEARGTTGRESHALEGHRDGLLAEFEVLRQACGHIPPGVFFPNGQNWLRLG